jgi:NgoMIV restriction enzyme.
MSITLADGDLIVLDSEGIRREAETGERLAAQTSGSEFESINAEFVRETFMKMGHIRPGEWEVKKISGRNRLSIASFEQYPNLKTGSVGRSEKATDQLMKHFESYNRGDMLRGLITLDISIVMNPRMYLNADSDEAIDAEVNALLAHFHTEFNSALRYCRDQRRIWGS